MNYSIITTAKNEELFISETINSVINQTILPKEWIIVDDHSIDLTREIVRKFAKEYFWIKLIDASDLEIRIKATGGRVATLFNLALSEINNDSDNIVKLDADISFLPDFFELLLSEFQKNEGLGVASGTLVFEGKREKIDYSIQQTRGAVMVIKKCIIEKTGGLFVSKGNGEDTQLSVAARYFGWETLSFPIFFNHLKQEGSKNNSLYNHWVTGFYKGSIPYIYSYFMYTQFKHIKRRPAVIGSVFQVFGYIFSRWIKRYRPFPYYIRIQLKKEHKMKLNRYCLSSLG